MSGYLSTGKKEECFGCEACVQVCAKVAIDMFTDEEGFRYPVIDEALCVQCGACERACPKVNQPLRFDDEKYAFGGYHLDEEVRFNSTSGGAFSAVVEAFCDDNYVIFGAVADGCSVYHEYILDKSHLKKFQKSKYSQSIIGTSYKQAKEFLKAGKKVLFSGTPCQIAGLKKYLGMLSQENLLTVEVICEGVPSPLYIDKLEKKFEKNSSAKISDLDYRYTGKSFLGNGKWDFEIMKICLTVDGKEKIMKRDRWFNPFWSIWLNHLMSRPSCYECPFATTDRVADLSLGDLWGVHLYCKELYGKNGGASLIVANSKKGKAVTLEAQKFMYGHELKFEEALKYQSPMRKSISRNPQRGEFMKDLHSTMDFDNLNKKWAKRPSIKLLWDKYVWGNRQKVLFWKIKKSFLKSEDD